MHSPSLPDVEQVSHHSEQHLCGVDGTVVIGRHLVTDQVLALLGCQLLAFAEGIDVDKVVDVLTPAGRKQQQQKKKQLVGKFAPAKGRKKKLVNDSLTLFKIQREFQRKTLNRTASLFGTIVTGSDWES